MTNTTWTEVSDTKIIRSASYKFPGGTSRSSIIRLSPTSVLVYSPGKGLADSAAELLGTESEVTLLAPSAGHTLGLAEWVSAFPNSTAIAASNAISHIEKRTSLTSIQAISSVNDCLSESVSLHLVPTCRWGEVWVSVELETQTIWFVCDAFINLAALPVNRIAKTMMSLLRYGPGLEVSRPFRYVGIRDKDAYKRWVKQRFQTAKRVVLVPCHGEILDAPNAAPSITQLITQRF